MAKKLHTNEIELAEVQKKLAETAEDVKLHQRKANELEAELTKREAELVKNLQIQQKYEDDKSKLYGENRRLEAEIENLKRDLEFVEKEMGETKNDNDALRDELKKMIQLADTVRSKDELMEFYKEKANKYDEIVKLQELNLIVILSD